MLRVTCICISMCTIRGIGMNGYIYMEMYYMSSWLNRYVKCKCKIMEISENDGKIIDM